ncbi:MAG: hypothetical protein WC385_03380, partial [Candidatus Paceibacterota bacterium]
MEILRRFYQKVLAIKVSFLDAMIAERGELIDDPALWDKASSGTIEKILTEIGEFREKRNKLA